MAIGDQVGDMLAGSLLAPRNGVGEASAKRQNGCVAFIYAEE